MGNDGGSIPTRRELVKSAGRQPTVSEIKATTLEASTHSWQTDPISGEPLELDGYIVSDWRGQLYNFDTVARGLVGPAKEDQKDETKNNEEQPTVPSRKQEDANEATVLVADPAFSTTGIRSLRDVVRLHATLARQPADRECLWQCPATLKELGPRCKAVYLVPCGHVFSETALSKVLLADRRCYTCNELFEPSNAIPILPTEKAEKDRLAQRIDDLRSRGLTHSLKKSHNKDKDKDGKKKHKKRKAQDEGANGGSEERKRKKDRKDVLSNGTRNGTGNGTKPG